MAKAKSQTRWTIVLCNGHIAHQYMAFTRRAVIEAIVKEYRGYVSQKWNRPDLTDAQLWRRIKGWRDCTVQRVSIKVM